MKISTIFFLRDKETAIVILIGVCVCVCVKNRKEGGVGGERSCHLLVDSLNVQNSWSWARAGTRSQKLNLVLDGR